MGSTESEAVTSTTTAVIVPTHNATASGSPQVHDSPLFSYISNLSPIKPVKAAHVAQGILELSSPPLVFTSPHINPTRETSLKRPPLPQRKNTEVCSAVSESSIALITESKEVFDIKNTLQPFSSPVCVDEYLVSPLPVVSSESTLGESISDSRKTESVQIDAKIHSDEFLGIHPDFLVCYDSKRKQSEHPVVQGQNDCIGPISDGYVGNAVLNDDVLEDGQDQRGLLRRCLIFEDGHQNSEPNRLCSQNSSITLTVSNSPSSHIDLEIVDSNLDDLAETSTKKPETEIFPLQTKEMPCFSPSKPSCIGLHLNSIVNSLPMGCSASAKLKFKSTENNILSVQRMKPESDNNLNPLEYKRKIDSEHAHNFEELEQMSPNTKQKMSPDPNDEEVACKMCNCKKTKCLKLYCDCFAAGIYCAEICSCQGCFNRPEFEKTVMETRQQIESRNPLAFGPKIATTPPNTEEDGSSKKISSLKHKKGCNCKKSTCLKKYCECFQANVGCSDGCRCVGCKNIYGMKEDYVFTRVVRHEVAEVSESVMDSRAIYKNTEKACDPQSLTPSTPLFDNSERHWQASPESDGALEKRSSMSVESLEMIPVTDQFTPELWEQSSFSFPSSSGSLRWRSSPITPSPRDAAFIVQSSDEKESKTKKIVEIRASNQKRISPPRKMSGRKFILRSVPSPIRPFLERDCSNSSKGISE